MPKPKTKPKPKKIIGRWFHCWKALLEFASVGKHRHVHCRCICGKTLNVRREHLLSGHSKSCGCLTKQLNKIRAKSPHFKLIELIGGGVATVDPCWLPSLLKFNWRRNPRSNYVYHMYNDGHIIYLHRMILGDKLLPGLQSDHINGIRWDCTSKNLRAITCQQNCWNWHKTTGSSRYRGVSFHKQHGRWYVQARHDGRLVFVGSFKNERQAAYAYDDFVREHRGPDAKTNLPPRKARPAKATGNTTRKAA